MGSPLFSQLYEATYSQSVIFAGYLFRSAVGVRSFSRRVAKMGPNGGDGDLDGGSGFRCHRDQPGEEGYPPRPTDGEPWDL